MAAFTAADVKALREKTGAGMMDAKKALEAADGDIEAAVDALRAKGLATAQKKSSRTAAEGLVGVAVEGTKGVAVEVNSETDFVAKNDQFQDFVRKTTQVALKASADDVEALKAADYPDGGSVADKLTNNVATIGENQQVRRMKTVSVTNGVIVPYMHNAVAPDLGKIGVLVALEREVGPGAGRRRALAALGEGSTEGVRAVAIDSSFLSYRNVANSVLGGTFLTKPLVWLTVTSDHDPEDSLAELEGIPLLFIHGDADGLVRISNGLELFEAAPEPKRFLQVPGARHLHAIEGETKDELVKFFAESLAD